LARKGPYTLAQIHHYASNPQNMVGFRGLSSKPDGDATSITRIH